MPDNNQTENNNSNNTTNSNDSNNANAGAQFTEVILGCDSNDVNDAQVQKIVHNAIETAGYKVHDLGIDPNSFANYSYSSEAKGKAGVYLMAASLISYLDAGDANFDLNVFGIRGDVTSWGTEEGFKTKTVPQDGDGNYSHRNYDKCSKMTYPQLNEMYKGKCVAVPGETPEKLAQNIVEALGGQYAGTGGNVSSGGGAQIKDKTFEKCIRRICAATDSIFLVENNAAVLFPYTDWMAFTLRQKINTIKKNEIDPNIFSIEYGNDGFYNKVSIAWGGATLPERFETKTFKKDNEDEDKVKRSKRNEKISTSYTMQDILNNMKITNFKYNNKDNKNTSNKTKKDKTTQEVSVNDDGTLMLSEQYDALVDKYGEMEKRVESAAPDFETAQYIVNALLIQYIRDFNNSCKCRALNVRKYIGGTFYAVENPFDETSELYYLNSYTIRTQKDAPLYHDLDFRYGPEGAEEILDYQTLSGGAAAGGTGNTGPASSTEEAIWMDAAKCKWAQDQEDCSTNDPATAKKHYDEYTKQGKEVHFDCFGMSAYLYYRFNYEAKIPCQVVGDDNHKVVMLNRGQGFVSTADEYRKYNLDHDFKWRENQNTTVLLPAPNSANSTSGGNTNPSNTNGGNNN